MKAVILAGGAGTRLRPLTNNLPKPMVPILNRPFLEHMLDSLAAHNVTDVIITVSYLSDNIRNHFGDNGYANMNIHYVLEESPLGTAGAVKNVENLLDDTFLVLNGDIFTNLDISKMLLFHNDVDSKATLFLKEVSDPSQFGVVEMKGDGYIEKFIEKPNPGETKSNWINGGVYILEPDILQIAPENEFYMFERGLFPTLLETEIPMYGYRNNPYWIDLGTPSNYLRVNHDILNSVDESMIVENRDVLNTEGYFAHPSAVIEGPVIVGRDCFIGAGSVIRGPTVIGSGVTIGEDNVISASVLWDGVKLGNQVILTECILADDVTVGDKVRIGNLCMVASGMNVTTDLQPGISIGPTG